MTPYQPNVDLVSTAAQWLAVTPRAKINGAVVPAIRQRFGLTPAQAIKAIRESNVIRMRAT